VTVPSHTRAEQRDVEVRTLTPAQFNDAKERALESVGLTYEQLKRQARRGEFDSPLARKVWMAVGEYPA
jgi:hypothetical protein